MPKIHKSKVVRKARQFLMNTSPGVYIALSKGVSRTLLFRTERAFLKGAPGGGSDRSFVLYAANRAGSMLLTRTLAHLGEENGIRHIDLERYFVHTDREQLKYLEDGAWISQYLDKPGFFFGALRRPLVGPVGRALPGLAVIRDPRDIVVSHYYAVTVGHTVFDRHFLEMKERAQAMSIDEYALDYAGEAVAQALAFWRLGDSGNVTAMRYEDILSGGAAALDRMAEALRLDAPSEALRARFDAEIRPAGGGDATAHKRSGAHGQFLTELRPETVEELERRYGDEIEELGYERSADLEQTHQVP